MTIRYTCEHCGSVLKIKDELSGTDGRCPKCKAEFKVPEAGGESPPAAPARKQKSSPADDAEFDPVSFLMDDGDATPKQADQPADAPAKSRPRRLRKRPAADVMNEPAETPPAVAEAVESAPPEPMPTAPTRQTGSTEQSASRTANRMLAADAANNARELLTKSMEESRVRAAEMPVDEEKPGIDYAEMGRELGLRFAPAVVGCVLAVLAALWFGWHMVGGGTDYPDLADVYGVVTKDGQPVEGAEVQFEPLLMEKDGLRQGAAKGTTNKDGEYELYYREGVEGAVVGKNRVTISKMLDNGRDLVPPRTDFGFGSNIVREVEAGSNEIDLDIP